MLTVSESVILSVDRERAWAYVTDPAHFADYVDGYRATEPAGEEISEAFTWRAALGPLRIPTREQVVCWDPPTEVGYKGEMARVPFRSAMLLRDVGAGRSRLTVTIEVQPPWWLPSGVLRPLLARSVRRSLARVYSRTSDAPRDGSVRVRALYASWGSHPRWYAAQDWITFMARHRAIRRGSVSALGVKRGARVLEVACGTGRNLVYLEQAVGPEGEITAFDLSPEMLGAAQATARKRGWSNIRFLEGDAVVLDVGDDPFDGVLSVLGMSAIPDHIGALRRCHDVLRPGATLSVCDARVFSGPLRPLNPLIRAVYGRFAAWDPERDLVRDIRDVFGNVAVEHHNLGTFFIARATRGRSSS